MEKYMEVKRESVLYNDYFQWLEDRKKMFEIFKEMKEKYGFESDGFYPSREYFHIVPTQKDFEKFKKDFLKSECGRFKKNTQMTKEWKERVSSIEHISKPKLFFYMNTGYSWRELLFNIGNKLYLSIASESDLETPDFGIEMKASEFYKIVEDAESREE